LEDWREEWRLGGQILSHSLYQKKILSPVGVVFGDLRNEETLQKKKTKKFVCQLRLMSTNIALVAVVAVSPAIVAFGVDLLALIAMPCAS